MGGRGVETVAGRHAAAQDGHGDGKPSHSSSKHFSDALCAAEMGAGFEDGVWAVEMGELVIGVEGGTKAEGGLFCEVGRRIGGALYCCVCVRKRVSVRAQIHFIKVRCEIRETTDKRRIFVCGRTA